MDPLQRLPRPVDPTRGPHVGDPVHYVSLGTPHGEYRSQCRAAFVTEVGQWVTTADQRLGADDDGVQRRSLEQQFEPDAVAVAVLNPTGMFLNRGVHYDGGGETPGSPDCPNQASHGHPFRYCPCGWIEISHKGGTWHWAGEGGCTA